jgi:hypothetical protein
MPQSGYEKEAGATAMIRDILRAALTVFVMSVAAGLLVEVRFNLAAIDVAHRAALGQQVAQYQQPEIQQTGRLRQFGRATLNLADAALGILR